MGQENHVATLQLVFYFLMQLQILYIIKNSKHHVKQSDQIDVDKYLKICEQLGQEPDPDKMPLEVSDLPSEVQVAFFIFAFLEDNWEGMSGTYLGKHWNNLEYLFNLYEIEEQKTILTIMKIYLPTYYTLYYLLIQFEN